MKKRRPNRRPNNKPTIRAVRNMLTNNSISTPDFSSNKLQPEVFRQYKSKETLLPVMKQYQDHTRGEYLMALVHPDHAVINGVNAKLPSDLPLPTASIGFRVTKQLTTSSQGTFLLSWRPCMLMTTSHMTAYGLTDIGQFTFNNNAALTGSATTAYNNYQTQGVYPPIDLQRYRLVSALMKLSYNGSVLNQSGTMLACATFDPFALGVGTSATPVTGLADALVDRFGNFSLIQNGLWNRTVNITKDADGVEALYVPMDPDDIIFQKANTYYGTNIVSAGTYGMDVEGAHIQYVAAGRNLPASSNCIYADFYYNFEVIADPNSAYLLKSSVDHTYSLKDKQFIADTLADYARNGNLIKPASTDSVDWTDVLKTFIGYGMGLIPTLL